MRLFVLRVCALWLVVATNVSHVAIAADAKPPSMDLLLTPHVTNGAVDYIEGVITLEEPKKASGGQLLRMPLLIVSIPTVRYDGDAIKARDADGELPLTLKDEEPTPTGTYRQWLVGRSTSGNVVVTFKAPPRVVSATTRTGPLFDLRAEGGGLLGAGITFLPLPDGDAPYRIRLKWNLSNLQPGSIAASSFGDGDIETTAPASALAFSFYAAGPLKRYPQSDAQFGLYWFTDPPFDVSALAASIRELRASMTKFFRAEDAPYRVFIRRNPHRSGGGTALPQSFMFGWNEATAPNLKNLQSLLAHEMAHNWPDMEGEHGDTAWYSEGAAEFYSLVLSLRAGAISKGEFVEEINERAAGYYMNPHINASNAEVARNFWSDWSAQRLPYGRGFMYLAQVDAKIRAKSKDKQSLDPIVVDLYQRRKKSEPRGIKEWLQRVEARLGAEGKQDYENMAAGKTIAALKNPFGLCLTPVKFTDRPFSLGFDEASINGEKKVIRGVVAGSPAELAGLRNGDDVLEAADVLETQRGKDRRMTLKVKRGEQIVPIEYLPRSAPVDAFKWEQGAVDAKGRCTN